MNKIFTSSIILLSITSIITYADNNISKENNDLNRSLVINNEHNLTQSKTEVALKKQLEREKKYAKEQRFYQGHEYDLSSFEIDKSSLDSIPLIEPDYDFDMDDVYD